MLEDLLSEFFEEYRSIDEDIKDIYLYLKLKSLANRIYY
jgi:hypothetical protein